MNLVINIKKFDYPVLLVALYLLFVPFSRLSNIPMALMVIMGIRLLVLHKIDFKQSEFKLFSIVSLGFLIPILCSLPDAVNRTNVLSVVGFYLSFFLSGLYIIDVFRGNFLRQELLLKICAFILIFWVADALLQRIVEYDAFGFEFQLSRLNGIFGEKNPKLGIYLAMLSPLCFIYCCRYFHWLVSISLFVGTSAVVFMSGRRTGWVMLLIVLLLFTIWQFKKEKNISVRGVMVSVLFICVSISALYTYSPLVQARVKQTALVMSGNYQHIDLALGLRLPIWKTAVRMIKAHPVNGVGARGFRYAYNDFADKDDIFVDKKSSLGAYQAHQLLLDVLANTGIIGLAGLLVSFCFLIVYWFKAALSEKRQAIPYALALIAVFFPINSHFATYSSQWASMFFWLIALYCAHLKVVTS